MMRHTVHGRSTERTAEANSATQAFDLWTRANVGEIMPGIMSPLGWSMMEGARNEAFRHPYRMAGLRWVDHVAFVRRFHGRVYMNLGAINHIAIHLGLPSDMVLRSLGGPLPFDVRFIQVEPIRPSRLAKRLPNLIRLGAYQRLAIYQFRRSISATEAQAAAFAAADLDTIGDQDLVRRSQELGRATIRQLRLLLTLNTASFGMFGFLRLMCEAWVRDGSLAEELVIGLDATRTGEGSLQLAEIAHKASLDPNLRDLIKAEPPDVLLKTMHRLPETAWLASALDQYLTDYGHRCAGEVDIRFPRWSEDPSPLITAFKEYVTGTRGGEPPLHRRALLDRRRRAENRAVRNLLAWQRPLFRLVLQQTRSLMPLREDPKFYLLKLILPLRRIVLAMAERLIDRGLMQKREEVFLLTEAELYRFLLATPTEEVAPQFHALMEERRLERQALEEVEPPEIVGPDGEPIRESAGTNGLAPTELRGLGASPGRATGTARVLKSLAEGGEVREGEVLVAPVMDPGWTYLFPLVSAIVTDLGGVLSHAAIVARELGIPAVVNTRTGSRTISTGLEIEVDGDRGIVKILRG